MEVIYTPQAVEDLNYWKKSGNKAFKRKYSLSWPLTEITIERHIVNDIYGMYTFKKHQ